MLLNQIGEYWNDRAEGYSKTIHEQMANDTIRNYELLIRRIQPRGEGLNCLDIGCGPGFFSILLSKMGHQVTSFDYAGEMLEKTRANMLEAGFEPHTVQGDAQDLPFEDDTFDMIVTRDCMWCLEHPDKAYAEWLRVLKPGGRLLNSDGNYYLYHCDESYKKERALREARARKEGTRVTHDTYGVDPSRIDNIAKELPLSRIRRPEWDCEEMGKLGFVNIRLQTSHHVFTDPDTKESCLHTDRFEIWGEKPGC